MVEKDKVVIVDKTKRAKLYYLRDRVRKASKTKEKLGARIENKEIIIKEEVVPGEAEPVEEVTEVVPETVEAVEEVKVESLEKEEEPKEEEKPSTENTESTQ